MMLLEKKIVLSFIEFLNSQIAIQTSPDTIESLEVAIQCLESAFSIDASEVKEYESTNQKLVDLFQNQKPLSSKNINSDDKEKAEQFKNRGNDLMKVDNAIEALDNYTKAIQIDATDSIYFCNRAAAHLKLNQVEDAIKDCQKALDLNPNYGKAYGRLGLAYITANRLKEAESAYKKALNLEPTNESYVNNLKIVREKLGDGSNDANFASQNGDSSKTGQPGSNSAPTPDLNNLFGSIFGGASAGTGTPFGAAGSTGGPAPPGGAAPPTGGAGGVDFSSLLNNPALINMASSLMANPNIQSALSGMLNNAASTGGPGNLDSFLNIGHQLASQIQNRNPELINQLRTQFTNIGTSNNNDAQSNNNNNPTDGSGERTKKD